MFVVFILTVWNVYGMQMEVQSCLPELSAAEKEKKANLYESLVGDKEKSYLGKGQFGKVYKVQYQENPPLFGALKIMQDKSDKKRFYTNEICLNKMFVGFSNIVQFVDAVIIDLPQTKEIKIYALLELGINSLDQEITRRKNDFMRPAQIIKIFKDIVTGLDHMHKKGVAHRDVFPKNIILFKDEAKIADFGISGLSAEGKLMYYNPQKKDTDLAHYNLGWMHIEGSPQVKDLKNAAAILHNLLFNAVKYKYETTKEFWLPAGTDSVVFEIFLKALVNK